MCCHPCRLIQSSKSTCCCAAIIAHSLCAAVRVCNDVFVLGVLQCMLHVYGVVVQAAVGV
jgi:hypothetical protein